MKRKDILLLACLLPFTSGLINSMGLQFFEVVTTNVAGHFGTLLQRLLNQKYVLGLSLLGGVVVYGLSAFGATLLGETQRNTKYRFLLLLPIILNVAVLLFFQIQSTSARSFWEIWLLFAGMGAYNAFSSNLTNGQVKPSQLTGLIIDACVDSAKIAAKTHPLASSVAFRKKNQIRWLIVLFFSLGIVANVGINQLIALPMAVLPLLFLVVVLWVLAVKIQQKN